MDETLRWATNLAWAAGIFEGEGWIGLNRQRGCRFPSVNIAVRMTDEDVVRRLHEVMGVGRFVGPRTRPDHPEWKPTYQWGVFTKTDVQRVAVLFWPWLGTRRKERFRECFTEAGLAVAQCT